MAQVQECMVYNKAGSEQLHQSYLLNNEQNWSKHQNDQKSK